MTMHEVLATPPRLASSHSLARQYRLTALAISIPMTEKNTVQIMKFFMHHVLSVDYVSRRVFFLSQKGQNALSRIKKEMKNNSLELTGEEEPLEQYLVKSLAFGRNWEEIISEHKLDRLFVETKYKWQTRELWIAYICWASFKWKEALYLAFKLLSRSKEAIQKQLGKVKSIDYYREKLHLWLAKDVSQIEKLADDQVRQLLLSVKSKQDMVAALGNQIYPHLNLDVAQRHIYNLWLPFLCLKFSTNYLRQVVHTCQRRESICWLSDSKNSSITPEISEKLEGKLQCVLNSKDVLSSFFTDEIEVMLVEGIRDEKEWNQVKKAINVFFANKTFEPLKDSLQKSDSLDNNNSECKIEQKFLQISEQGEANSLQQCVSEKMKEQISDEEFKPVKKVKCQGTRIENKIAAINSNNKVNLQELRSVDLTSEQQLMLSLLKMGHQHFKSIQTKYFHAFSSASLHLYAYRYREQITPLAEIELNYYRTFPEKISLINNPLLKSMIEINLATQSTIKIEQGSTKQERSQNERVEKQNDPFNQTKVEDAKGR